MPEADLAWLLAAFALVLLMFPGLALYYGGMVSVKQTLNMTMMIFGAMAISTLIYVIYGHGMVVGNSVGGLGIIGNPLEYFGFQSFTSDDGANGTYWSAFYILFAAISSGIVASGAAGRMKFWAWMVFTVLWQTLVYYPLAHWVFTYTDEESGYVGGWMRNVLGLHDFAGGTAVHMISGLVGITPAADAVNPIGAIILGAISAIVVAWLIPLIPKARFDDSLDAFPVHTVGGIVGALYVVLLGSGAAPAGVKGILLGGDLNLVWKELVAIVVTCVYAFVVTYVIVWVMDKVKPIRVSEETEKFGIDEKVHAETAYDFD